MSGLEPFLIAAAVGGSILEYQATVNKGKAERDLLNAQAEEQRIQARKDALNSKEKGIKILEDLNKSMASINARAGAGNMNPYASGVTSDVLMAYSLRAGVNDFTIARDKATISLKMGEFGAKSKEVAGRNAELIAKQTATAGFVTNVATTGMSSSYV